MKTLEVEASVVLEKGEVKGEDDSKMNEEKNEMAAWLKERERKRNKPGLHFIKRV